MEKFIPYEKLSKKGSNPTAAGGGSREGSEWQRSADASPLCRTPHLPGTATGQSAKWTWPSDRPGALLTPSPANPRIARPTTETNPGIGSVMINAPTPGFLDSNIAFKSDSLLIIQSATFSESGWLISK